MPRRSLVTERVVLDAWAVLAWLGGEPGADEVHEALRRVQRAGSRHPLSAINAGEVCYRLVKAAGPDAAEEFIRDLRTHRLPVQLVPATNRRIWEAARLKAKYPIAYAAAFAVVLAREMALPLLTGDRDLVAVEEAGECTIRWLGRSR